MTYLVVIPLGVEPNSNTVFGKAQITCFLRILISNKYFQKYLYLGTRKILYQKAAFPHETVVHARMSEWVKFRSRGGVKEVTDTSCSTQQQRRLGWAKKDLTASLFFFNRFVYLNWVPFGKQSLIGRLFHYAALVLTSAVRCSHVLSVYVALFAW